VRFSACFNFQLEQALAKKYSQEFRNYSVICCFLKNKALTLLIHANTLPLILQNWAEKSANMQVQNRDMGEV
jgi:hypothetical protein